MFVYHENRVQRFFVYFSCILIFSAGVCWKRKTFQLSHYTQNYRFFRYFPFKKQRQQQNTKPNTKHTQKVQQIVNDLGNEGTLYLQAFILV